MSGRRYTKVQRCAMVDLVLKHGWQVSTLAKGFGVPKTTLLQWVMAERAKWSRVNQAMVALANANRLGCGKAP